MNKKKRTSPSRSRRSRTRTRSVREIETRLEDLRSEKFFWEAWLEAEQKAASPDEDFLDECWLSIDRINQQMETLRYTLNAK